MPREIIRNREIVEDDWLHIDDETSIEPGTSVIVSLQRWQSERDAIPASAERVGLRLPNDVDPEVVADDLAQLQLVALTFPVFSDGRAYSQARLLREKHDYRGELRAIGDVLRDQIFYMHRCGFNAFEVREDRDIRVALTAFEDFTTPYQAATDSPVSIFERRRGRDSNA